VNVVDAKGFRKLGAGSYLTGEAALEHKNQINLYRSFRRLLGTNQTIRPAITGSELVQVQVRTLVSAVVTALLRALVVSLGNERLRFPQVVVTVPASGNLALEYELRRVFDGLQIPLSTDLDESTAACVYYLLRPVLLREFSQLKKDGSTITPGRWYAEQLGLTYTEKASMNVLCIDQGGGTTDLSLLEFLVQEDDVGCDIDIDVRDTTGFSSLNGEAPTRGGPWPAWPTSRGPRCRTPGRSTTASRPAWATWRWACASRRTCAWSGSTGIGSPATTRCATT
jgi:molecular chaperone DnaK (HSP70)